MSRSRRMSLRWRYVLGGVLVLHGLAHTLPGMRAAAGFEWWPTAAWAMALAGFLAAGAGLLGAATFQPSWRLLAAIGTAGSAALLGLGWPTVLSVPGLVLDLGILAVLVGSRPPGIEAGGRPARRPWSRIGDVLAVVIVITFGALVVLRPWYMRWGSTDAELRVRLPGDELVPDATYLVQHAITIPASPEEVWPWLAQLGQDRGGFYSYSRLENLLGLGIRNADRIHSEWQDIAAGDSIYATPDGWLGFHRRFGWRVARAEPGRVLALEGWGAFVLQRRDDGATRLIVRTRGGGPDRPAHLVLAPLGFLLFEPAHFIMERKMLLELKRLASPPSRRIAHGEARGPPQPETQGVRNRCDC